MFEFLIEESFKTLPKFRGTAAFRGYTLAIDFLKSFKMYLVLSLSKKCDIPRHNYTVNIFYSWLNRIPIL